MIQVFQLHKIYFTSMNDSITVKYDTTRSRLILKHKWGLVTQRTADAEQRSKRPITN